MTQHDHSERVSGCFRCEIGADEAQHAVDTEQPQRVLDAIRESALVAGPRLQARMAECVAVFAKIKDKP